MSLPAGRYTPATTYLLDASGRVGGFTVYSQRLTAANLNLLTNEYGYFKQAIQAVCLGVICETKYTKSEKLAVLRPSNGASVKTGLMVTYRAFINAQKLHVVIPTFNPALPVYVSDQNDAILMTTPPVIANLVTEWRYMCVPPRTPTSGVEVIGLRVVGRNVG